MSSDRAETKRVVGAYFATECRSTTSNESRAATAAGGKEECHPRAEKDESFRLRITLQLSVKSGVKSIVSMSYSKSLTVRLLSCTRCEGDSRLVQGRSSCTFRGGEMSGCVGVLRFVIARGTQICASDARRNSFGGRDDVIYVAVASTSPKLTVAPLSNPQPWIVIADSAAGNCVDGPHTVSRWDQKIMRGIIPRM
jgi:hypothetical protein